MTGVRILGLGNDLLADDAFGLVAAGALARRFEGRVDVRSSASSGLDLLDEVTGASHLLVIDTLVTGRSPAGTVFEVREGEIDAPPGQSPHYVGLFEALTLGRAVGLRVPGAVTILAVEPEDVLTVGGRMSERVTAALGPVVERAATIVTGWLAGQGLPDPPEDRTSHVECQ